VILVHVARGHDPAILLAHQRLYIADPLRAAADNPHDDLFRRRFARGGATGDKIRRDKSSPAREQKPPPGEGGPIFRLGHKANRMRDGTAKYQEKLFHGRRPSTFQHFLL
jgi:hypothetical protein